MFASRNRFRGGSTATALLLLVTAGFAGCQHGRSIDAARPNTDATVLERDEITEDGVTSVAELIEGRLSSVRLVRSGAGVWFEIRGPSTFSGNPAALVVVDGVEASARALLAMSPADIERIQVLKGAAAARYGMRGGNGVLVITTRRHD